MTALRVRRLASPQKSTIGEGETGPGHWGDMDALNKVCSVGSQQSPLDIGSTI
jgi:carbonic anhydrase